MTFVFVHIEEIEGRHLEYSIKGDRALALFWERQLMNSRLHKYRFPQSASWAANMRQELKFKNLPGYETHIGAWLWFVRPFGIKLWKVLNWPNHQIPMKHHLVRFFSSLALLKGNKITPATVVPVQVPSCSCF